MKLLNLSVLFIIITISSSAQTVNDTILASQYYKKADSLLTERKYDGSIGYFKKALSIYEKTEAWGRVASCYNKISKNQKRKFKYKDGIVNLKKGLEILKLHYSDAYLDISHNYSDLASLYYHTSDYKKALEFNQKALKIRKNHLGKNHLKVAQSSNNIGLVYAEKREYEKAINSYKKSLVIWLNSYGEEHVYVGIAYLNIGVAYYDLFQNEKAIQNIKKALRVFVRMDNPTYIAYANTNIGTIFLEREEYDNALEHYQKALSIHTKSFTKNQTSIALLFHNIGIIKENKKAYEEALKYHKKALNINISAFGKNHRVVADSYSYIGSSFSLKGDHKNALQNFRQSLRIHEQITNKNDQIVLQDYLNIAQTYLKKEDFKESLNYYNKALYVNSKLKKNFNYKDKLNPNEYLDSNILLFNLNGKGKALESQYLKNNNSKDLDKSAFIYQNADAIINTVRQSYQNYQDKISFAKQAKEIYSNAIKVQLLLYNEKQEQQILAKAFYYSEKSKSNTLKEFNNDTNAKNFAGLPSELLGLEKTFKINHAFYRSQILDEQSNTAIDSIKIKEFENKLFDISRRQDSLTEVLENNYPKYHQLKYNNEVISVTDIQKKLNRNQTLLEFFVADSITYAFTISKNELNVKELSTPKLTKKIEQLREDIVNKNTKAYKTEAYQLYQQLIAPIKNQLVGNELIIVPDGPLWHLNFDLLLTLEDDSNDPKELSYLLKDYAITYANSATLLFNSFKTDKPLEKQQECLAFSFTDSTNVLETKTMDLAVLRGTDNDLPGTRKEIKAIADIIDGQYFYGSEANEKNFKKNAPQYNILHLALHGDVDNERPENSKLYFTKSKDTLEDSLLYSHELFALNIPAELTVLSACNTGTGKIVTGEGIMSLGNAFQYAGTKSLLLNSWEVDDETAPTLMKYFYTNLKEGMNKAQALQKAKLQYINTTSINRTDPFYWGGFYLVGDSAPIKFNDTNYWYWVLGFVGLAILLLSIFWYKRKTNI